MKVSTSALEKGNDVFIRYNEAISIYHKVKSFNESKMEDLVSIRRPFGLSSNFRGKANARQGDTKLTKMEELHMLHQVILQQTET